MKHLKIVFLFSIILFISIVFSSNFCHATTTRTVNDEETLKSAITASVNGDSIELSNDIELTSPIEITDKNIKIDGNGHSISKKNEGWAPNGSNGTLITAGMGARIELINLTLKNSQKYGVQAYNGGYVLLNGVTITNCAYGGVLVNAGTVEVKNLNLGKNGTSSNNGIEIGKGAATSENNIPEIVMNGTLSSTEKENVIYVAENNDDLKKFEVKNTDNTTDKILISGDKVVITDKNNNVLFSSNTISDVELAGDNFVKTPAKVKKPAKDTTPKTGVEGNVVFAALSIAFSLISIVMLKRKEQ